MVLCVTVFKYSNVMCCNRYYRQESPLEVVSSCSALDAPTNFNVQMYDIMLTAVRIVIFT